MLELQTQLNQEVAEYRAAAFSDNTKKTYASQIKSYLTFCEKLGVAPTPASNLLITQYAAYLARRMKPSSVRQYLNVIRLLHLEDNRDNPLKDNWYVKSTLAGIDRKLGNPTNRKVPVTPTLLMEIGTHLDRKNIADTMFWAAAMVMFFGTFRKSNLLPEKVTSFSKDKQFVRSDFVCSTDGTVLINVKYSKTIQFKERSYVIKLVKSDHVLCPVTALYNAFSLCPLHGSSPAFVQNESGLPMTGRVFNKRFKEILQSCGKDPTLYASHSFRRGSATWALQCGIPGEIVKQMGDWKSSCYELYLDQIPQSVHDYYRLRFVHMLPDV